MQIRFDHAKNVLNQAKHGISLKEAEWLDWSSAHIRQDNRSDYGEVRWLATGDMNSACMCWFLPNGRMKCASFRCVKQMLERRGPMKKKKNFIEYEDGTRIELDEDDAPELTGADFKRMRPAKEVLEELWGKKKTAAFLKANKAKISRGRPKSAAPKEMIAFRLPPDLIAAIKASGRGYGAKVEKILRAAIAKGAL